MGSLLRDARTSSRKSVFHELVVITTVARAPRASSTVGYSMRVDGTMCGCVAVTLRHHPGRVHFRARDAKRAPRSQQWSLGGRVGFPIFSVGKPPWQVLFRARRCAVRAPGGRSLCSAPYVCGISASVARCIAQRRVDEPSTIVDGACACPGRELRLADAVKEQWAPRGGACGKRPCASCRRRFAHAVGFGG